MNNYSLHIDVLDGNYCVCKGLPLSSLSHLQNKSSFFSLTKTNEELSVVCDQEIVPHYLEVSYEKDWRLLKVAGPLDFALVGILSNLSSLLTKANISIFVISTFDTDYLLVKQTDLPNAVLALEEGGHIISHL